MAEDEIINDPGAQKLPTMDELMAAIEKMGLDEESKRALLEDIKKGNPEEMFQPYAEEAAKAVVGGSSTSIEFLMLFGLISLILLVLAFFGYKLYNNLVERERKKEMKRKLKQQKKKK